MTRADLAATTSSQAAHPAGGEDGGVSPRADRPRRRTFTTEYKLGILAEYDAAEPGARGMILRREGLYSSHVVEWRRARDAGALTGAPAKRGRPGGGKSAQVDREVERLRARA